MVLEMKYPKYVEYWKKEIQNLNLSCTKYFWLHMSSCSTVKGHHENVKASWWRQPWKSQYMVKLG